MFQKKSERGRVEMSVLSLRLSKKEAERIKEIAMKENKKKGEAARSLLSYGWFFSTLIDIKRARFLLKLRQKNSISV